MTTEKQTILAIDDVPANLKLLGEILQQEYRFLVATSGAAGLEIATAKQPDLILLDVMMPDMDGYEVCTQLKANPLTQSIPVIFITALKEETDETRGLEIGAIDYVTKPFSPAIVRIRVRNHLELKRYHDLLESQAVTDGLTGIANRRQFDKWLDREWRLAIRRQSPISLILGDIDCFKLFNDHYGHPEGDECLKGVAKALAAGLRRPSELLARYGGEEFACILPDTDLTGATHFAGNLLEQVRALKMPHETSFVTDTVTMSLGAATMSPKLGDGQETLIQRADEQLYAAKKAGRNQVASSQA
jgi:diguanylate cyclase (GGDEF)-like protein